MKERKEKDAKKRSNSHEYPPMANDDSKEQKFNANIQKKKTSQSNA